MNCYVLVVDNIIGDVTCNLDIVLLLKILIEMDLPQINRNAIVIIYLHFFIGGFGYKTNKMLKNVKLQGI